MKIILLSGGSGKRLFPLSNDSRSKQFLKLLRAPDGSYESMAQRVWRQLKDAGLSSDTIISTSSGQVDILTNQIGEEIPIALQPEIWDTYSAIVTASAYLHTELGIGLSEPVVVMSVDSYVDDSFFDLLKELAKTVSTTSFDLALAGVLPTYPAEKYGYILPKQRNSGEVYSQVSSFREKPKEAVAVDLISQGALWNCGVFAFELGYMLSFLPKENLPLNYNELLKVYTSFPKISIDYAVVEKEPNLAVIPFTGSWKDLGSWDTITEEISEPTTGEGFIDGSSENVHIINDLGVPVGVFGISNAVVIASPDGILVADKSVTSPIKDWANALNNPPSTVEFQWGTRRTLSSSPTTEGEVVTTSQIEMKPMKSYVNRTASRDHTISVLEGSLEISVADPNTVSLAFVVGVGEAFVIPRNSSYTVTSHTLTRFILIG